MKYSRGLEGESVMCTETSVDSIYSEIQQLLAPEIRKLDDIEIKTSALRHTISIYNSLRDEAAIIAKERSLYSSIQPRHSLAEFYVNADTIKKSCQTQVTLSVRNRGLEIGQVKIYRTGLRKFRATVLEDLERNSEYKQLIPKINLPKPAGKDWSSPVVREYLTFINKERSPGGDLYGLQSEHYVESLLLKQMIGAGKSESTLAYRRPFGFKISKTVTFPFQFPVPISGSTKKEFRLSRGNSLGHIDILGKRKKGNRSEIEVIEIKKPNIPLSENVISQIFRQAIAYTACLEIMYNKIIVFKNALDYFLQLSDKYNPQFRATICINAQDVTLTSSVLESLNRSNSKFGLSAILYQVDKGKLRIDNIIE